MSDDISGNGPGNNGHGHINVGIYARRRINDQRPLSGLHAAGDKAVDADHIDEGDLAVELRLGDKKASAMLPDAGGAAARSGLTADQAINGEPAAKRRLAENHRDPHLAPLALSEGGGK